MNTEYINKLRKEYIENHIKEQEREELIRECNIEESDVKGYHGREILELLQNADDAYQKSINLNMKPDCDLEVEIKYNDNIFSISNTGTFFDKEGIKSVVEGNNSNKKGNYIGCKGTGFRSVLNWADKVRIYSGEFAVEFSKDIAKRIFDSIKDEPQIVRQLQKRPSLYIPMLCIPENIEFAAAKDRTTIEIEINQNKIKDDYSVVKQIDSLDMRILLFLPNLSKISIDVNGSKIVYERDIKEIARKNFAVSEVELNKIVNDNIENTEKYTLFQKEIPKAIEEDGVKKSVQLAVALPCDRDLKVEKLYSYFPLLDTDSPFNCVLHATYSLDSHRNAFTALDVNKIVVKHQLGFLLEIAEYLVSTGNNDDAYRILLPVYNNSGVKWKFVSSFAKFNLEEDYINLLGDLKIFETANGLISVRDNLKVIKDEYPEVLYNNNFPTLLRYSDNRDRLGLLELISSSLSIDINYSQEELCELINRVTDQWTVEQQVDVFVWWNKYSSDGQGCKLLPNLIKTQQNNWLGYRDECFLLEGNFDNMDIPLWVTVPSLGEDYQRALLNKAKGIKSLKDDFDTDGDNFKGSTLIRKICAKDIFRSVNFTYRDRNTILHPVNSSVNTYDQAVEFVKWLWLHYGHQENKGNNSTFSNSQFSYNFPTDDKSVEKCGNLYFGKAYGNVLSNKLFSEGYKELADISCFDIEDNEKELFKSFMREFGILDFPEIVMQKVTPLDSYGKLIKNKIWNTGVLFNSSSTCIDYCTYKLPYIRNLYEILQSFSMSMIIHWVMKDNDLLDLISKPNYSSNDCSYSSTRYCEIYYHGDRQRDYTRWPYYGDVPNYILYLFNNVDWVEIKGEKYAPIEVLNGYESKNNNKFKDYIPILDASVIQEIAKEIGEPYESVVYILSKFNFAKKITDLSSSDFYGLLLELQEKGIKDMELSKLIYRIIEQSDFNKDFEDSDNKKRYKKEGKMLVRFGGHLMYHVASDCYLPSTKIIIKNSLHIVEKGSRTNNVNFVNVFGCKEYKSDYKVVDGSEVLSKLDNYFQLYFSEFIKYARAYSEKNENIGKNIDKLKIRLVNSIKAMQDNNEEVITENYTPLRKSVTSWFIVLNENKLNINLLSEHIEAIFSNIANSPGFEVARIGELFRTASKENREFLIKKEFGSLAVIDDSNYVNLIRENFKNVIKLIDQSCDISVLNIDFEDFDSFDNAPILVKLFKSLSVDIEGFVNKGFNYNIDFTKYFRSELEKFIQREKTNFKNVLFSKCLNDKEKQKSFIHTVDEFEQYSLIAKIENSVNYDFKNEIKRVFDYNSGDTCSVSADKVYTENYKIFNSDDRFSDEISGNTDVQRMIYFGLKDEFDRWMGSLPTTVTNDVRTTKGNDPYSKYRQLIPENQELISDIKPVSDTPDNGGHIRHKGSFNTKNNNKKNSNLKRQGNIGELLIYNLLIDKFGDDRVKPVSEAFEDLGIIAHGLGKSGDYDISYMDENGDTQYVEVKTGEQNVFYMSEGELLYAKEHAENYHLYYVYNINESNPHYEVLPSSFWMDEKYGMKEIVEKIEFKI